MTVKSAGEEEERREEEGRGKKGSLLVDEVLCESNFVWAWWSYGHVTLPTG